FENLSKSSTDGRFVEAVINGRSRIITVQTGTGPLADATQKLDGGADGDVLDPNSTTVNLQTAFHSAVLDLFEVGAIADRIDLFNMVCVPGESHGDTIQKLQKKCADRRAFLVVDCTQDLAREEAVAEMASLNGG